eukprot:scaffold108565_cov48-Phaeocystis_antarctica.AAC.1
MLLAEPWCSRSKEKPLSRRTRIPARMPIASMSDGSRCSRCSIVVTPRVVNWGSSCPRLSACRNSSAFVACGTLPRSRSPYLAVLILASRARTRRGSGLDLWLQTTTHVTGKECYWDELGDNEPSSR